jgi:hypothetical protein
MLDVRKLLVTVILTTSLFRLLMVILEIGLVLIFICLGNLFLFIISFRVAVALVIGLDCVFGKILKIRVLLASLVIIIVLLFIISVVRMLVGWYLLG